VIKNSNVWLNKVSAEVSDNWHDKLEEPKVKGNSEIIPVVWPVNKKPRRNRYGEGVHGQSGCDSDYRIYVHVKKIILPRKRVRCIFSNADRARVLSRSLPPNWIQGKTVTRFSDNPWPVISVPARILS
jgi:hypothetical protein